MLLLLLQYLVRFLGLTIVMMAGLTALEILLPRVRGPINLGARLRGGLYFLVSASLMTIAMVGLRIAWESLGVKPLIRLDTPAWLAWSGPLAGFGCAMIYVLVFEFFGYWHHRLLHGPFWRLHAIHHSIRDLNSTACYAHAGEEFCRFLAVTIPMSLIAFKPYSTPFIILAWMNIQNLFIHNTSKLSYGPLALLISDNRYHRIHHSVEERHFDKNFGTLITVWDWVFGTAYFPKRDEWPETGLADQPPPASLADMFGRPFRLP